jgi:ABC-2 type transport system ATP-binding protein
MRSSKGNAVQGKSDVTGPAGVLVAARGAGRRYSGRVALAPIDLEVRGGESVALLGPNGAGKTTLLTLLAGAADATEGTVERMSDRTGWVPQRPALYRKLSARENLRLFAELERLARPHEVAERLLEQVDLLDAADRPAQELSVGNVQRLNVAIGLVADPAVVFLDEPTASLDPRQRARLWELLRGVTGRGGAVVFATQNVEEAHTQADRLVVLQEGRLVFAGAQETFWEQAGVENSSTGAFERAFVRFLDLQAHAAS